LTCSQLTAVLFTNGNMHVQYSILPKNCGKTQPFRFGYDLKD